MENDYAFTWLTNSKEGNNMFGKMQFANFEGALGKMEQDVASAASALETSDKGMTGAPHYNPVFFCGRKPVRGVNYAFIAENVRGVNYAFIAEKTQAINPPLHQLVAIEVNFFDGEYEVVKSSEIKLYD